MSPALLDAERKFFHERVAHAGYDVGLLRFQRAVGRCNVELQLLHVGVSSDKIAGIDPQTKVHEHV